MSIVVDPVGPPSRWRQLVTGRPEARSTDHRLPGIAVAAAASIGAGAIHASAAGVHAEHPALARLFVVCAIAQLGVGLVALVRPGRGVAVLAVAVNGAAVTAWLVTRVAAVSWIDGLQTREAPHFADTTCAALGAAAAGTALAALMVGWHPGRRQRLALPSLVVAAFALPAMTIAGSSVHTHGATAAAEATHVHTHDAAAADAAPAVAGATGDATATTIHDHGAAAATAGVTGAGSGDSAGGATVTTVHDHGAAAASGDPAATAAANWPRPYDPAKGIDISGVPGVTPAEEARARQLILDAQADLPKWADTKAAIADGYASIGDAGTGVEHYIKYSLINDDTLLDPTAPESLVYKVDGTKRTLQGAMFIASARSTDDPTLTSWAGPLMQWHNHGNLCWSVDAKGKPIVVGIVDASGKCAVGVNTGGANPMVHVWIAPNPCGPFAALEGVGAGQAAVPESQRADLCHAATHDHGSSGSTAPVVIPYDPTKPIDLSGTPGVTPEQQAHAENIVAETLIRLPKWADYHTAEAAGFQSIGDGATGFEHYIKWDWINDDVSLDPDHPESLVYAPQPDGSKKLVSAMFMLPDNVTLDQVPNIGGALMQWHIHDNLCFTVDPVAPKVAGITSSTGGCPAGLQKFRPAPMIHVWITPNACGPFAALEGVGAGQVLPGETRNCDHQHGDGLL